MGFRFRKSYKIAPGVKVNVGKKSGSISLGTKGARHTISTTGRKTTSVGIPGTGIGYVSSSGGKKKTVSTGSAAFSVHDYSEYINPDYREILSSKEYAYYEKCTKNGFLFNADPKAILTQSGKRNSVITYDICYFISLIISIILFLISLFGFATSVPVGLVFLVFAAIMYLPFRGYRKMTKIHKKIFSHVGQHLYKTDKDSRSEKTDISSSAQNDEPNISVDTTLDLSQQILGKTMKYLKVDDVFPSSASANDAPPEEPKTVSPANNAFAKSKLECYEIAGTSCRQKEIESLGEENDWYFCSKNELIDDYMTEEYIYQYVFFPSSVQLVEEPDNVHDPNAIKVIIDDVHVGYIEKESCSHIKKLLRQGKISDITADISGGRYKYISSEYDFKKDKDVYVMETDYEDYCVSIDLVINE